MTGSTTAVVESSESPKIPHYTSVRYQREAFQTWKNFYEPDNARQLVRNYINGTLSCFCEDSYLQHGFNAAFKYYRPDGLNQLP